MCVWVSVYVCNQAKKWNGTHRIVFVKAITDATSKAQGKLSKLKIDVLLDGKVVDVPRSWKEYIDSELVSSIK